MFIKKAPTKVNFECAKKSKRMLKLKTVKDLAADLWVCCS